MTNENNKFIPKAPEQYIVCELKDQQVKKSPLSPAARSKVISKSGSNYLSPWTETEIGEPIGYGPGIVDPPERPVSISGPGSSRIKSIVAGDKTSLIGDFIGVKTCAAMYCLKPVPRSEYYCYSHRGMVGGGITRQAQTCDEIANRNGGMVIVSQDRSKEGVKTKVKYDSSLRY